MSDNNQPLDRKLKVVRLNDAEHVCVYCRFFSIADVILVTGEKKRMAACTRYLCDEWIEGETTPPSPIDISQLPKIGDFYL